MPVEGCIADDHGLILRAICSAQQPADDIEVVAMTQSGADLVDAHLPDVVLLDGRMPGLDGLSALKLVKEAQPDIKVIMLSASEDAKQCRARGSGMGRRPFEHWPLRDLELKRDPEAAAGMVLTDVEVGHMLSAEALLRVRRSPGGGVLAGVGVCADVRRRATLIGCPSPPAQTSR